MGMTIDEILRDIKINILPYEYKESLYETLNILRKYQKIQEIIKGWENGHCSDAACCLNIKAVVDGDE